MNDIAIITGVVGGYDAPQENQFEIPGVDYIFFTDGESVPKRNSIWRTQEIDTPTNLDPRRQAKFPKINPQRYASLREYKYVIWMDGTLQVRTPRLVTELLEHMNDGVVFSPHFENRDNYSEATITGHPKYRHEPLPEQVEFYRQQGQPEGLQLYECTTLAWDPNHPVAAELSALWLQQNLTWSYQDQVSLTYAIWKLGIKPGLLPKSWREYNWYWMGIHQKDEANGR